MAAIIVNMPPMTGPNQADKGTPPGDVVVDGCAAEVVWLVFAVGVGCVVEVI